MAPVTAYKIQMISVWVWRRPGQSSKAYRRDARTAAIHHEKTERNRRKAYQRAHAGSTRGYVPITFGKV